MIYNNILYRCLMGAYCIDRSFQTVKDIVFIYAQYTIYTMFMGTRIEQTSKTNVWSN